MGTRPLDCASTEAAQGVFSLSANHALLESLSVRSWTNRLNTILRVTLTLLTSIFPLGVLASAAMIFLTWIRVHAGNDYYVEHFYLGEALLWMLVGLIGVLPAGWVLFRPRTSLWWLTLPVLASVFVIVYPRFAPPLPYHRAIQEVYNQLVHMHDEYQQIAKPGKPWPCSSGPMPTLSPYSQNGKRLFYHQVCVTAKQPMESLLHSSAPGTIYVGISPGEQTIWLFATVLSQNMSDTASWLQDPTGTPVMFVLSSPDTP